MSAMRRLFELMAERKASDVFISAGAAISIKIAGVTMAVNQQIVKPDMIRGLMKEVLSARQMAEFEEEFELNTSYPLPGVGSFRISAFMQRSTRIRELLKGQKLHTLRVNANGEPAHPLYLPGKLKPISWAAPLAA